MAFRKLIPTALLIVMTTSMTAVANASPKLAPHVQTSTDTSSAESFDVFGVRLFMSASEVIAVLEKKVGKKLIAGNCEGEFGFGFCVQREPAVQVSLPGDSKPRQIAPGYVSAITYGSQAENLSITIYFAGETPGHAFGKPESATLIQYAYFPHTTADQEAFRQKLVAKYGQPTATLVGKTKTQQPAGILPPSTIKAWSSGSSGPAFSGESIFELLFHPLGFCTEEPCDVRNQAFQLLSPSSDSFHFPLLVNYYKSFTTNGHGLAMVVRLCADPTLDAKRGQEIEVVKSQLLKDANRKTTGPIKI